MKQAVLLALKLTCTLAILPSTSSALLASHFSPSSSLPNSDYVTVPAASTKFSDPGAEFSTAFSAQYNTSRFLLRVDNPAPFFHVFFPILKNGTCGGYELPSDRARTEHCLYATNGGPFIMGQPPTSATCIGYAISNGVAGSNLVSNFASFGLTKTNNFILGVLQPADVKALDFVQLLTGFGWLVRDGVAQRSTDTEVAPRTAIGVDKAGRLLMLEVDGIEATKQGLTLNQLADWFLELGAYQAINLDGGGSSVAYFNGTVVDHPTSDDTGRWGERRVTTSVCIKSR